MTHPLGPPTATSARATRRLDPPGPVFWEPFTPARVMLRDPLGFVAETAREHGDIVRLRIGPLSYYSLSHPDHVRHVLQENHTNYVKGPIIARAKILIGDGLFTNEGEGWRRQRRLVQPAFHRQRVAAFGATMAECGRAMLDRWQGPASRGETFDLMSEMSRVTLQVVGKTLFSLDLEGEARSVGEALVTAMDFVVHRVFRIFYPPLALPTPANLRFRRALHVLDSLVQKIIDARRRAPEPGTDLLGLMIGARDDEGGGGMTDRQLRDEVMTFVLAGHETTAVSLAWTWVLLCRHPEVHARLCAELERVVGHRDPGPSDLPALSYTRMVVEESLRLYPPLWAFGRQAVRDDEIGGYRIRAGSPVNVVPWLTHRHPDFWDAPERFDPERFSPEKAPARHRFAYIPFSAGPRLCIGNDFALQEATLLTAMMAQRYAIELAHPERAIEPEVKLTVRPRGGVPVRIRATRGES